MLEVKTANKVFSSHRPSINLTSSKCNLNPTPESNLHPLLPPKPTIHRLPLPLPIRQRNLIPIQNRGHKLIRFHQRQVPPQTNPRPSPKAQVTGIPLLHSLFILLIGFPTFDVPQPPLRPKLVRIRTPNSLVPVANIRIDTNGHPARNKVAVGKGEPLSRDITLKRHSHSRMNTERLPDHSLEVGQLASLRVRKGVGVFNLR